MTRRRIPAPVVFAAAALAVVTGGCWKAGTRSDAAAPVATAPSAPWTYTPPPVPYAYRDAYGPRGGDVHRLSFDDRMRWQAQLDAVRPRVDVPLTVMPVAHRSAPWEGEFADVHYTGPGAPSLPPLPGDRTVDIPGFADRMEGTGRIEGAAPGGPALRVYRETLRPMEQLVYGGEHPELSPPEAYRFESRDRLRITVREHPELSGEVDVGEDGRLRLPGTDDFIPAQGKTVDDIAVAVRRTVAPYLKGAPEVTVDAVRTRGAYYSVFGAVRHPGRYPMGSRPVRLSEAVLSANWTPLAGDESQRIDELGPAFPAAQARGRYDPPGDADLRAVRLFTPHRSRPMRTLHDVEAALTRGARGDDPYIRPGQIVVVPSTDPSRPEVDPMDADPARP